MEEKLPWYKNQECKPQSTIMLTRQSIARVASEKNVVHATILFGLLS